MTRDRYLKMCEQMGQEPIEDEIPPDWEDFPTIAIQALTTFSDLGDRVVPDVGYMGKDFHKLTYIHKDARNRRHRIIFRDSNLFRVEGYQTIS